MRGPGGSLNVEVESLAIVRYKDEHVSVGLTPEEPLMYSNVTRLTLLSAGINGCSKREARAGLGIGEATIVFDSRTGYTNLEDILCVRSPEDRGK